MKYTVYLRGPTSILEIEVEGSEDGLLEDDPNTGLTKIGDSRVDRSKVLAVVPSDQLGSRVHLKS